MLQPRGSIVLLNNLLVSKQSTYNCLRPDLDKRPDKV